MDARLTDEQQMLVAVAEGIGRRFGHASPVAAADDERAAAWSAVHEAGLVGMCVPVAHGGAGASIVDAALVVERLAAALVPVPLVGSAIWAPVVLAAAGRVTELGLVFEGSLRVAPAVSSDLRLLGDASLAVDTRDSAWALGLDAGGAVVRAELADEATTIDLTRTVHGCGKVEVLGELAPSDVQRALSLAHVLVAADLVGAASAVLDAAVHHVRERHQFGKPVGSFQAVQHLAADAHMRLQSARSSMLVAAWSVDAADSGEALRTARRAKAWASEVGRTVGETALQMFGGIGFTWEMPVHVWHRRILFDRSYLGDENLQYDELAAEMVGA